MSKKTTRKTTVRLDFGEKIKIALASDLHGLEAPGAIDIIRAERPDIICCAGDMFDLASGSRKSSDIYEPPAARAIHRLFKFIDAAAESFGMKKSEGSFDNALRFFTECARVAPTYYAPGNHDRRLSEYQYTALKRAGVAYLCDMHARVGGLTIGGLSGVDGRDWLAKFDKESGTKLLLSHQPEHYPQFIRDTSISLTLSGHAHGGQWRFFGRGVFAPGQGLFPKYTRGAHENRLVISAGLSNTSVFPRLNNPPEIVIIISEK